MNGLKALSTIANAETCSSGSSYRRPAVVYQNNRSGESTPTNISRKSITVAEVISVAIADLRNARHDTPKSVTNAKELEILFPPGTKESQVPAAGASGSSYRRPAVIDQDNKSGESTPINSQGDALCTAEAISEAFANVRVGHNSRRQAEVIENRRSGEVAANTDEEELGFHLMKALSYATLARKEKNQELAGDLTANHITGIDFNPCHHLTQASYLSVSTLVEYSEEDALLLLSAGLLFPGISDIEAVLDRHSLTWGSENLNPRAPGWRASAS